MKASTATTTDSAPADRSDSADAGPSDCPGHLARADDSAGPGDDFGFADFSGPAQLLKLISAQLATQLARLPPTGPAPHDPAPYG
ncbi:hypothetical protein ACFY41_33365 [Streptomyces syringium]|uniref:hypothetical protein n=1 Tax=Streptomyces syringium TaxID=76729 RepID=UPI0036BE28CC